MPRFSVEPIEGANSSAFVWVGIRNKGNDSLQDIPLLFRAFNLKAELAMDDDIGKERILVDPYLKRWKLDSEWFFIDATGFDLGYLIAVCVYLTGHFRSLGIEIKMVSLMTSLPPGISPALS